MAATFTQPFEMPLSALTWKKRYHKEPTSDVRAVMAGLRAGAIARTVKIDQQGNVLRDQGEDICEAARRINRPAVTVQMMVDDPKLAPLPAAAVEKLIKLRGEIATLFAQLSQKQQEMAEVVEPHLTTEAACAAADFIVPDEAGDAKLAVMEARSKNRE